MSGVGWEEAKRQVRERRAAAGLPVRCPAEKRAAMDRLVAEVSAHPAGRDPAGAGARPEGRGDTEYTVA
ncbi:hypothetical protein OG264_29490 [Streptomyces xanthophaeus]|uniref:hypothetical protein n=1 Tax=Streptomyces xanthophaeus TaxID=67385 RepID=UPI0038682C8D|nr:hypothetical protein OG264_29490 [Streptomyces xanthophaeus]WST59743.1 hypothetical protein OG605_08950 [Streptomyces xanthophaeus]